VVLVVLVLADGNATAKKPLTRPVRMLVTPNCKPAAALVVKVLHISSAQPPMLLIANGTIKSASIIRVRNDLLKRRIVIVLPPGQKSLPTDGVLVTASHPYIGR
jgi:hypothetical protein